MSRSAGDAGLGRPGGASPGNRSRGWRRRLRLAPILLIALALLPLPAPAAAQTAVDSTSTVLISQQVRYSLGRLQDGWFQWTTALFGNDEERAREVVDLIGEIVEQLGMQGVPDLAAGALVEAVESAHGGETERAALALEAAERLAPGRPETAFAAAEVARLAGDWPGMVAAEIRGYARLPRAALERRLALYDVILWALASLLLAAGLFVLLEMAMRGPAVARDLGRAMAGRFRGLPAPAVTLLVVVALLWPLALPSGLLWLLLYWSFLVWGYVQASERAVLVAGWLLVVATPMLVTEIDARVAVDLSPAGRAMVGTVQGDLYGGLFADLGVLPAALPDEPAVDHFLADLHVRLGQWDEARRRYDSVLEAEPENVPALVNVGVYYFNRNDFSNAVFYFRRAAAAEDGDPSERTAAWYDLSLAYADSNLFDEQAAAFAEARSIDDGLVSEWQQRPDSRQIVTVEGGLARVDELKRALRDRRRRADAVSPTLSVLRRVRSAILVVLLAAAAIAAHAATRHRRGPSTIGSVRPVPGRWSAALVPGLVSLAAGQGRRAFAGLVLVVAPLLVLLGGPGRLGYELPWRHDPAGWLLPSVAVLTLALVVAARTLRTRRTAPVGERGG